MEFYIWPHRCYFPPPSRIDWTMCDVKQKFNQIAREREREREEVDMLKRGIQSMLS